VAVILLFPFDTSEQYEEHCKRQNELVKERGLDYPSDLFFLKQVVGNACGTMALIHALANTQNETELQDGILKEFISETSGLSPEERGLALGNSEKMAQAHGNMAEEGQTLAPDRDVNQLPHFAAFVHKGGSLYELDGKLIAPLNHGPTNPEDFLKDAAKVCQIRMARDPTDLRFTLVALTTAPI
jgi:ubiquitin carboxyl-terminal hydrolase L3